jgi:hypothetical protein
MNQQNPTMLDITPSPRVLEMLGEIEFAPWRCAAELLDNSIDSFLDVLEKDPDHAGPLRVNINLPRPRDTLKTITVVDSGPGMTLKQVNDAVRAGWSGNDPFENLGLFGMGFNIASARLGQRTRVLTTRQGDSDWYGVEIDLKALQEDNTFEVPLVQEAKDDPDAHGTRVELSVLRQGNYEELVRNPRKLADQLGDVYAPLLLKHPKIEIRVNNIRVQPRGYCRWDESREITYGTGANADRVPAVIPFDHALPARDACRSCRRFQELPNVTECEFCGSHDLVTRERRIHGWVGVQRYLHGNDFGIDFIRNGRKIMIRDKSLFRWVDPNDISNTELIEYPIEPPANEGRIIGEVHLDHVPVEYRKETFRTDSPEWQAVRKFLRGDGGPMRPQYRTERNLARFADGPLARIYKAFNANRPGARYLIPAAPGGPALHDKAYEWGKKFHDGDPAYQDDSLWWAAIEGYERAKEGPSNLDDLVDDTSEERRRELVEIFGDDAFGPSSNDESDDPAEAGGDESGEPEAPFADEGEPEDEPETFVERVGRYAATALPLPELQFTVSLPGALGAVDLVTYLVKGEDVLNDENQRVPVLAFLGRLTELNVFVDADHPLFTAYDTQIADMVLAEVADIFRARFGASMTLGQIIARIKEEKLSDRRLDDNVAAQADSVLREIRDRVVGVLAASSEATKDVVAQLAQRERAATETAAADEGKTFADAVSDGSVGYYIPALALPRIVEAMPQRFLDGAVFTTLYSPLSDEAARSIGVARIAGYLYDLGILADRPVRLRGEALRRAALSVRLIEESISESEPASAATS